MTRLLLIVTLLLATTRLARAGDGDAWDGSTMAAQAGGGVVGAALVGSLGGIAGLLVGASVGGDGNWGAPLAGAAIGMGVGGVIGIVIGVQVVGDGQDGTGSKLATTLGEIAGLTTIAGYQLLMDRLHHRPSFLVDALVGLAALVGPVVGYQLTNSRGTQRSN